MDSSLLPTRYDGSAVLLSVFIAAFASYLALDLARRVRRQDRVGQVIWTAGGALVLGTGIWAMHFIGMLGFSLPIAVGYDVAVTAWSWLAAVGVSTLALLIAARDTLGRTMLAGGSLVMGAGICAMHYIGMGALQMAPGIVWNGWLVVVSVLIAVGASAVALLIFFGIRRLSGTRARLAQGASAVVMGVAISGMHYTGMAAAGFPEGSVCLSADGLSGNSLGTIVVFATLVLLLVTLATSALDARQQARAMHLTRSLKDSNQQLRQANTELQRLAFSDVLTGVANRTLFDDRLHHSLARSDREPGHGLAVLFIDLDGFKPVNDCYGHGAGDDVLREIASRLQGIAREADTLARVGGDEFVLLLDGATRPADAEAAAARILETTAQPVVGPHGRVTLSCSIGFVLYPTQGQRERLLACADAAMYAAKRDGGNCCVQYRPDMRQEGSERLDLLQDLHDALAHGQLSLHYQPQVETASGRVLGVEALLRWRHPASGWIGPGEFVPLAERHGLIVPLGNWVIEAACSQAAAWQRAGHALTVSINLSAYQLRQPDLVERITSALGAHDLPARLLICEITESVAMQDMAATRVVLARLRQAGVSLSIDDFGTGYSSLSVLRHLELQELKIDRQFVQDLTDTEGARALVRAVVQLAHALGLRVVAEGVETETQRVALASLGCDELQGYLIARPMPAADLPAWLLVHQAAHQAAHRTPAAAELA